MFDDLDETLRQLLIAEMPVKNGEIEISFDQPKREWSSRLNRPTVNVFLYDVRENQILRQHQWERMSAGNGHDGLEHLKRTPIRVDCTFMITSWAKEPDDEHRLLTRCLMALFRFPVLPKDRLVGSLRNPPFEIQTRLASHDKLTNPAEVWASLDNEIRPSISYMVTLALDPWQEVTSPIVHTLTLRTGQASALPEVTNLNEHSADEANYIRGKITNPKQEGLPGIEVAIKGTGLFTRTDSEGDFILGSLPSGNYTLVAWPPSGKPMEKKISIPEKEGNYDMEI